MFYTLIFLFAPLFCAPLAQSKELKWLKAESFGDLKKIIKKQQKTEELKALCLRQLSKKQAPIYCYEWLLHTEPKNKSALLQYLDERCLKFPLGPKSHESAQELLRSRGLSRACGQKIFQEKKKRRYQLRDRPPSYLLKWHFPKEF